ncbi:alpha/beta hydrolase fold [Pseudonocardia sp. Ae168_Ps1]|uniref:alpha/beta fold hydrolase n=1 Tax=unclassified Pseudonocardia TaxID=2619320 RepID=UPI0009619640|nr:MULTISPECIES: alpha/beta hydrolase [unclassified Pseudonocardia]OLL71483.1 alpha/beta hydrolase fold [Pseudonocardia sp. Ae168_Ps1]
MGRTRDRAAEVRERAAREQVARHGGTVDRPLDGGRVLPLAWVRARGGDRTPVVVLPGGPGLASVLPYHALRQAAVARGLDVIMVEHRGVGLSRTDGTGQDVTTGDVTTAAAADDVAAVLDANGVDRAVVLGTSYGSYLAQVFGARHPERVAAMVLDSPSTGPGSVPVLRAHLRRLYRDGADPRTARSARHVAALAAAGKDPRDLTSVVRTVHEFAGPARLERLLAARVRGGARRSWAWIAGLGAGESAGRREPMIFDGDLVRPIGIGELGFGVPPDGEVLDLQRTYGDMAGGTGHAAPHDLAAARRGFGWPVAVISGERDLRTPRPVAEQVVAELPDGVLVPLAGQGHSATDTHSLAALNVAHVVEAGAHRALPRLAGRLAAIPRRGMQATLGPVLTAAIGADTRIDPGCRCAARSDV